MKFMPVLKHEMILHRKKYYLKSATEKTNMKFLHEMKPETTAVSFISFSDEKSWRETSVSLAGTCSLFFSLSFRVPS